MKLYLNLYNYLSIVCRLVGSSKKNKLYRYLSYMNFIAIIIITIIIIITTIIIINTITIIIIIINTITIIILSRWLVSYFFLVSSVWFQFPHPLLPSYLLFSSTYSSVNIMFMLNHHLHYIMFMQYQYYNLYDKSSIYVIWDTIYLSLW